MSYDFSMAANVGGEEPATIDNTWRNYTSNVSPMWSEALGHHITELENRPGRECYPLLVAATELMEAQPDRFKAMNPENGWGDYDGALSVLRELASWCRKYPDALLEMSY